LHQDLTAAVLEQFEHWRSENLRPPAVATIKLVIEVNSTVLGPSTEFLITNDQSQRPNASQPPCGYAQSKDVRSNEQATRSRKW
jgi:hypothetical protein